jgi:hypothetical protein
MADAARRLPPTRVLVGVVQRLTAGKQAAYRRALWNSSGGLLILSVNCLPGITLPPPTVLAAKPSHLGWESPRRSELLAGEKCKRANKAHLGAKGKIEAENDRGRTEAS